MGERRWRAAREAGFTAIPAIVRETGDDELLRDALLENLHRSQLNPLEEAAAYDQLLQDFGCTHDELAGRIGRSRPQISNTLRLLKLPPRGAAPGRRRGALGGACPGPARPGRRGRPGAAGPADRRRGPLGPARSRRSWHSGETSRRPTGAPRSRRPMAPKLAVLADRLSDRFETRVKVDLGRSKGRIVVEFGSIDDLERIVALMAPDAELPSDLTGS